MSPVPADAPKPVPWYQIRLRGHLESRWAAWFDGMTLTRQGDGTTTLSGPVIDQAALHGLLQRARDAGLPLISVTPLESARPEPITNHPTDSERKPR